MTRPRETHYATSGDLQIAYQSFGSGPDLVWVPGWVSPGARVAATGDAGDVLVTRTVKDLTAGAGIEFRPRGTQALRGVPGDWELYSAHAEFRDLAQQGKRA